MLTAIFCLTQRTQSSQRLLHTAKSLCVLRALCFLCVKKLFIRRRGRRRHIPLRTSRTLREILFKRHPSHARRASFFGQGQKSVKRRIAAGAAASKWHTEKRKTFQPCQPHTEAQRHRGCFRFWEYWSPGELDCFSAFNGYQPVSTAFFLFNTKNTKFTKIVTHGKIPLCSPCPLLPLC